MVSLQTMAASTSPSNLNDTFRVDGQRVNFSAYPASVSTVSDVGYSGATYHNRRYR